MLICQAIEHENPPSFTEGLETRDVNIGPEPTSSQLLNEGSYHPPLDTNGCFSAPLPQVGPPPAENSSRPPPMSVFVAPWQLAPVSTQDLPPPSTIEQMVAAGYAVGTNTQGQIVSLAPPLHAPHPSGQMRGNRGMSELPRLTPYPGEDAYATE